MVRWPGEGSGRTHFRERRGNAEGGHQDGSIALRLEMALDARTSTRGAEAGGLLGRNRRLSAHQMERPPIHERDPRRADGVLRCRVPALDLDALEQVLRTALAGSVAGRGCGRKSQE